MYTETGKQSGMYAPELGILEIQNTVKVVAIKVTIDQAIKYYLQITVLHKTR